MKYDDGITHTHEIINDDSMYRLHLYVDYHSKHFQIFSLRPSVKTLSASILIRRLVEVVVVFCVCVYTSLSCPFCVCVCCSCVPFCFFHSICSPLPPSIRSLPVVLNVFWPVYNGPSLASGETAMIGRTDATIGAEDRLISAIRIGRLPTVLSLIHI